MDINIKIWDSLVIHGRAHVWVCVFILEAALPRSSMKTRQFEQ